MNSIRSCHALTYGTASSNCGVCPINASATCTSVPVDGSACLFHVQTTVCDNNHGPLSTSVSIALTGEFMAYKLFTSIDNIFIYSTSCFTSQNCAVFFGERQKLY